MPLPIPVVRATASGKRVEVEIIADAFFYLGGTTFEFDDPTIEILSIDLVGKRKATLGCNTDKLAGTTVTFTAKSTFYYHEGSAVVSQPS